MQKRIELATELMVEIEFLRMRVIELDNTTEGLNESKRQLIDIINCLPDAVLAINKDSKVIIWNRAMEQMTKIPAEDILGKGDYEYAIPFYGKRRPILVDLVLNIKDKESVENQYSALKNIGHLYWSEAYAPNLKSDENSHLYATASVLRDSEGNIIGAIECIRDNTDRKALEEKLMQSEKRYRDLINNSSIGFYTTNLHGTILFTNQALADIFGYDSIEELMLTNERTHFRKQDDYIKIINILQTDGQLNQHEVELLTKNGESRLVLLSAVLDGDIISGTIMNVTQRQQTLEDNVKLQSQLFQAQEMEAIGTLAGGVAHDFNNLLMGIEGYASLSMNILGQDHPIYSNLRQIEELVTSGAKLTSQLLGFARGGKYEVQPTNINRLLERSISIFSRTSKDIIIDKAMQDDIWAVEVDQGQIEQVFLNLFINARQAMPRGGDLFIKTENHHQCELAEKPFLISPGKYVKISVTDTGMGMDKKTLERIFEPFFTTKKPGQGTGLELACAYGIVKNHAGYIVAQSQPGQGSTFIIYLPASNKGVQPIKETPEISLEGQETILVVDDEVSVANVTKGMLQSLGYRVFVVGSGPDAIVTYAENKEKISLIILDMIMPGMSGRQTFKSLLDMNRNIKVILASGYSIEDKAQYLMESGCRGVLQKPFTIQNLSRKVRDVLDGDKK